MRQGGDPRLPLELALVKVTRPGADLSRESTAYRLEQLEQRLRGDAPRPPPRPAHRERRRRAVARPPAAGAAGRRPQRPPVELEQLQEAWQRTILPAVESARSRPRLMLREARPAALAGDTLTSSSRRAASFHRSRRRSRRTRRCSPRRSTRSPAAGSRSRSSSASTRAGEEARGEDEPRTEDEFFELVKDDVRRPRGRGGRR